MAIDKDLGAELKELQKEKRELKTRERELRENLKIEKDIQKWQKIMDVRSACRKLIKDAGLGMSLTKLDKYPDYYIYQHPLDKKLKTADRNAEWVKKYVGEIPIGKNGGPTGREEDLLSTARKSTLAAWKRMSKKKKLVKKYLSGKGSTGKGRTSGTGIG
jgi:hypothetical protein